MRRTRRNPIVLAGGVTLLEMIVAMVLLAIVVGATIFFANPIQQAGDVTVRAQLTDMADNALQRMGREVRLALPNSVRVTTSGVCPACVAYLEFLPLRSAGRYRAESAGTCNGVAASDALVFDASDNCFKALGPIPNFGTVVSGDLLVLNNYGNGFVSQNAYDSVPPLNYASVQSATADTVLLSSTPTFQRKFHESPGRRFFIVGPPVTYVCDPTGPSTTGQKLTRHTGYVSSPSQPTSVGTGATLANFVTACTFDYSPGFAAHLGLLTLRLTLGKAVSTGTESISLYHALHVNNLP